MAWQARLLPVLALLAVLVGAGECARPPPAQRNNAGEPAAAPAQQGGGGKRVRVIIDHDGGIEDLLSVLLLLAKRDQVDLLLVSYLEADSIRAVATNTTLKLMHFMNRTDVPLAVSTLTPPHAFPLRYRSSPLTSDVLPQLNPPGLDLARLQDSVVAKRPGQEVLASTLLAQPQPVLVLATGPLTNIAHALESDPRVAPKIQRLWAMGGTLRQPGNIFGEAASDGSAEWNLFSDPEAAATVWASGVPLTLVPLDATNKVPITPGLLYALGARAAGAGPVTQLVATMYAPTVTWTYQSPNDPYYAWDQLATACMLAPAAAGGGICRFADETLQVVRAGPSQGALRFAGGGGSGSGNGTKSRNGTKSGSGSGSSGGSKATAAAGAGAGAPPLSAAKRVTVAVDADAAKFNAFMLDAFWQQQR